MLIKRRAAYSLLLQLSSPLDLKQHNKLSVLDKLFFFLPVLLIEQLSDSNCLQVIEIVSTVTQLLTATNFTHSHVDKL